jgi:hypothetical protein
MKVGMYIMALEHLNNIRREDSWHFRNEKEEYLKDKMNELAMNSKNKNIRDLYRFIIISCCFHFCSIGHP